MKAIKLILIISLTIGLISCVHKLQFNTSIPASNKFQAINTLAIGEVKLVQGHELILRDDLGQWTVREQTLDSRGIEAILKHSLISNLSRFSDFEIIDLEEFKIIYSDTLNAIKPLSGFSVKGLDAILNLKIALELVTQKGSFQEVKTFQRSTTQKVGKDWKTTENSSSQRVVNVPYQTKNLTVILTGEVIKVHEGQVEHLGTFSDVYIVSMGSGLVPSSFAQEPKGTILPFFTEDERSKDEKIGDLPFYRLSHDIINRKPNGSSNLANRIAVYVSNTILVKFSRYNVLTTRTIDTDGDDQAVEFLKQAQVEKAKKRIETIISNPDQKTAENIYNLAICYEALGEYQIARELYEDALRLDEGNSTYIEAVGALENKEL